MNKSDAAFDAFLDDCYLGEDPICNIIDQKQKNISKSEKELELVASQIITGLIDEDNEIAA